MRFTRPVRFPPHVFSVVICFLIVLAVLSLSAHAAQKKCAEEGAFNSITVFLFLRVGDDRYPSTNVPLENFVAQMDYLAAEGYRVFSFTDLVRMLKEGTVPEKATVLTFDDGFRSVYTNAWPVLRARGFPFTVFLYLEGPENGYGDYMAWDEIGEMVRAGVDIQDHGYSHLHMTDIGKDISEKDYRNLLREELAKSAKVFTRRLGRSARFFSVPYGEYNNIVIEEVRAQGYEAFLTEDPGPVSCYSDLLQIPREPILGRDWATLKHFREVLANGDLPLVDMLPSVSWKADRLPVRFGARVLFLERYVPGSFGVYVSEIGWQKAQFDDGRIFVANDRRLTRRFNRVMISAREKKTGRTAVRYWFLSH